MRLIDSTVAQLRAASAVLTAAIRRPTVFVFSARRLCAVHDRTTFHRRDLAQAAVYWSLICSLSELVSVVG